MSKFGIRVVSPIKLSTTFPSRRKVPESVYKEVASIFVHDHAQPLSLSKINRVLRRFSDLELFNVGMRNRAIGTVTETYRQLAGSAVHGAIDKGDGALYHRGHILGYVRDTCISHAWHIHCYLKYWIMPTKGGKRMGGSDFMASSLT